MAASRLTDAPGMRQVAAVRRDLPRYDVKSLGLLTIVDAVGDS
jgi:hypothetical protein